MTDVYPDRKQYEHKNENERAVAEESAIPESVGVYDRPEHSGLPPMLVAILAIIALVVISAAVMLFLV